MTRADSQEDYFLFSRYLEKASGIVLGPGKQYLVSSRLGGILQDLGVSSLRQLLDCARKDATGEVERRIIEAMTTNETLWFRDQHPFETLSELVFPEFTRRGIHKLRIWSAACSTGQEPYSIAMVAEEYRRASLRGAALRTEIIATDIAASVLRIARDGVYDALSLGRGLTAERRARFFECIGERARVNEALRHCVQFRELNLLHSYAGLGRFHIVFCRNVLIYFSPESKKDIVDRMSRIIEPGGFLFLGGAESMTRHSDRFESVRARGGMVFRRKMAS
ncbi:MAG TPA: protein-glutamate O-methyltransferase CheR [Gammaproteobacteria bacterium]|nr:protein-glutamate O-methyltransferase CheR [Gammaproteobacteria bacterium]